MPLTDACVAELAMTTELTRTACAWIAVAIASRRPARSSTPWPTRAELTLVGFVAFLDPPKESAAPAIAALASTASRSRFSPATTSWSRARSAGRLAGHRATSCSGSEIESMPTTSWSRLAEGTTVFAKLTPRRRRASSRALKRQGHTVGFLGDGINDAPALREADVGISVDTAVDIAKESADIILLEKSLLVLEEGVLEGPPDLRQHHQVHQDGGQLELRQRVQRAGRQCLPAVPADAADPPADPEPALRHLRRSRIPFDRMDEDYLEKPRNGTSGDIGRFMLCIGPISSIFDLTTYSP